MKFSKYWLIFKRDFRLTRLWVVVTISLLGFIWLLYSINKENTLPFLCQETWTKGLVLGLWVFPFLVTATPIVGILNYVATSQKRRVLRYREKLRRNFVPKFATLEELPGVTDFGYSLVGDSHIDLETLKRRYSINSHIVTCLYSADDTKSTELLGYYIMYPLSLEAYTDIHSIRILNGSDIKDHHITPSFSDAAALYIGMAGGKEGHAEGYVIDEMLEQISTILYNGKLKALCTRGATPDGKRVIRNFGFQKLADPSEISCLLLNKEVLSNKRIKRHLAYR